jgi:hypothetical protein
MSDRVKITVKQIGEELFATWDGQEVHAGRVWNLDSMLGDIGAPVPRDLCLVEIDGRHNDCCFYHSATRVGRTR